MSADAELSSILSRRQQINDALENGENVENTFRSVKRNIYTEFQEFSRKEIKEYQATFNKYDVGHDGYLDLAELKIMMEKLGAPQTHLSLKKMISEVDEDNDGKISFREFLLIYRKAKAGELASESGLEQLARLTEINVEEVGVNGAKNFFEAKIEEQLKTNKFHDEIRQEQEEKKRLEQEKILRRAQFQQKAAIFNN
ncbi:EF-hand domain-containing protein D2 homolog [Lutzomyia longipalpis]|uniref:Putative swiprosin n=1 Tax=Lutzomyia longipalpis TaxID=7200 RepID=A0A1B0GIX0_LUTLO|nr:EF-hand domain-containing protein D2 homolog [Lutzomyia longipalpis]